MKRIIVLLCSFTLMFFVHATSPPRYSYQFFEDRDHLIAWLESESAENYNHGLFRENVRDIRSSQKFVYPQKDEFLRYIEVSLLLKQVNCGYDNPRIRVVTSLVQENNLVSENEIATYFRDKYGAKIYANDVYEFTTKSGEKIKYAVFPRKIGDEERVVAFVKDGFPGRVFFENSQNVDMEVVKQLDFKTVELDLSSVMNYEDVNKSDWFYYDAEMVKRLGYMEGTSEKTFSPYKEVTWAEAITAIWRAKGFPKPETTSSDKCWYSDAVAWDKESREEGVFKDPMEKISRQDFAVLLYKHLWERTNSYSRTFSDIDDIDEYVAEAVYKLSATKVINGRSDGIFAPDANLTRAELAAMLHRITIEPMIN